MRLSVWKDNVIYTMYIVKTAFIFIWKHYFAVRTYGAAMNFMANFQDKKNTQQTLAGVELYTVISLFQVLLHSEPVHALEINLGGYLDRTSAHLDKSMCTSLEWLYLLYVISFESGSHPMMYETQEVYLLFMKAKDTASKMAATR